MCQQGQAGNLYWRKVELEKLYKEYDDHVARIKIVSHTRLKWIAIHVIMLKDR